MPLALPVLVAGRGEDDLPVGDAQSLPGVRVDGVVEPLDERLQIFSDALVPVRGFLIQSTFVNTRITGSPRSSSSRIIAMSAGVSRSSAARTQYQTTEIWWSPGWAAIASRWVRSC